MKVFIRGTEAAEEWVEQEMSQRESENDRYWNDLDALWPLPRTPMYTTTLWTFPISTPRWWESGASPSPAARKQRTGHCPRSPSKDAQILILDDALSAVDTDTEAGFSLH